MKMEMQRWLLLLALLSGCGASGAKRLELTLTMPDGKKSTHTLGGETGFLYAGGATATVSWPDIGTWNTKVPVGLSMDIPPLQAGRYSTSGHLHLGSGTVADAKSLTLQVSVDRVKWQNSGAYPFLIEGTLSGSSSEGHQVEGRFTTTTDDCTDKVRRNNGSWLCGFPFPSDQYREQKWTVGRWDSSADCPAELVKRYVSGQELTLTGSGASAGGEKTLQCQVALATAYRAICGASDEALPYDGCTWSVTAFALPGAVPTNLASFGLVAATTNKECTKVCTVASQDVTHVSGATFQ